MKALTMARRLGAKQQKKKKAVKTASSVTRVFPACLKPDEPEFKVLADCLTKIECVGLLKVPWSVVNERFPAELRKDGVISQYDHTLRAHPEL